MLLHLQKYNLNVTCTRGKELFNAETLSRAIPEFHMQKISKLADVIAHIQQAEWIRKVTDARLNQIRDLTNKDEHLQSYYQDGLIPRKLFLLQYGHIVMSETSSPFKIISFTTAATSLKLIDQKCYAALIPAK